MYVGGWLLGFLCDKWELFVFWLSVCMSLVGVGLASSDLVFWFCLLLSNICLFLFCFVPHESGLEW